MCMTLFCLVFPFFLFLHVCCFINVALSSSALLSFVRACFAFSCWCCRLDERLGRGGRQDDEESLFASDAGSWYTVSDVDCGEDGSDDGNDDVDDDSTTSVDGSDDDDEDDDGNDDSGDGSNSDNVGGSEGVEDRFTLQRCRRRVRNVIVSDTDSDNSGA